MPCTCAPCISDMDVEAESGLGGRLERLVTLGVPFGGNGKAPMLGDFRTVLPGVGILEAGDALS